MSAPTPAPRRLDGVGEIGAYDAVYVSPDERDAPLSCAGRIASDRRRGLRGLVVTLSRASAAPPVGCDQVSLASAGPEAFAPPADVESGRDEGSVIALAQRLEDVFRRSKARSLFIPLGVGGHADALLAHEAALRTFHAGSGRDVYLYEERPDAFVSGSVRIRLATMGARLPPAASRVRGEGGLLRLLVRTQTVPRLRQPLRGLRPRAESARRAARQWFEARAWRPSRALGPRVQPLVFKAEGDAMDDARSIVRAAGAGLEARAVDRLLALAADQSRRLGAETWAERSWLLLPEHGGPAVIEAAGIETAGLVS